MSFWPLLESDENDDFWLQNSDDFSPSDPQPVAGYLPALVQSTEDVVSATEAELAIRDVFEDTEPNDFLTEVAVSEVQGADGTSTYLCPVCGNQV